jgi:hypothetical protein
MHVKVIARPESRIAFCEHTWFVAKPADGAE